MKSDIVIIGAGLGGLECASYLSRRGLSVVVVEQAMQAGGSIQSYRRRGHPFDTGLHYVGGIGEGQSLYEAFSEFGLLSLPWKRMQSDGFDRVTICGESYDYCEGFAAFAKRMSEYFPEERAAIHDFTSLVESVCRADKGSEELINRLAAVNAWDYLTTHFHSKRLIDVLSGTALKMELRRSTLPLFNFVHTLGGYIESSWKLRGDGNQIVEALEKSIRYNGGRIVCGKRIDRIEVQGGRAVAAISTDGETFEAQTIISDIHPALTCGLIDATLMRRSYRNRLMGAENTFGMFTVSLTMPAETLPYTGRNEFIYSADDVWSMHERPLCGRCVMVSAMVPTDGSAYTRQVDLLAPMAWTDVERWIGTSPMRRGDDYKELKQQWTEALIRLASSRLPEIKNYSQVYTSTPLTWHDYTLAPQGSAYGMRKDAASPLTSLMSVRTPLPNLLLTGQNLMLHGIQGVSMTALMTCKEIIKST